MKKIIVLMLVVSLFLFGCVEQPVQPEENVSVNVSVEPSVPSDVFTVVAVFDGATWKFKLKDYSFEDNTNPFSDGAGGDLGKGSTAYIKINESDLKILAPFDYCDIGERQSIWITPKLSDGKGVIFEAVYLADFKNHVGKCKEDTQKLNILGKEYVILELNPPNEDKGRIVRGGSIKLISPDGSSTLLLKDGGGFNGDTRWPVVLGWKNGELRKIIIYMGGYFYDIEENKSSVPLFGAGNRILAKFSGLDSTPRFELITTDIRNVSTGIVSTSPQTNQTALKSITIPKDSSVYVNILGN